MNGLFITLAIVGLITSSIFLGIFVREDSLAGVLYCSLLVMIFLGVFIFSINFEEANPYTLATVLTHNGLTTIFQVV